MSVCITNKFKGENKEKTQNITTRETVRKNLMNIALDTLVRND
jgi:hypothetical protein